MIMLRNVRCFGPIIMALFVLVGGMPKGISALQSALGPSEVRPPEYGVVVARDIMMTTRDGTRLATDVYRPARDGTAVPGEFPTLLTRTPYDKDGGAGDARFHAERGYVVVVQDTRGRFKSEGTFYIYLDEGEDGYDAVEWITEQPWSNGDVGTYGGSYLAATQMALARLSPPGLRGMFARVGTSNYFQDGAYRDGAFYLLHNLAYAMNLAAVGHEAAADPAIAANLNARRTPAAMEEWLWAYPHRPNGSPLAVAPSYQRWYQDWIDNATYADAYWQQNGYDFESGFDEFPDIPMYFLGGWYDIFVRGTVNNFTGLSQHASSPVKMMMGPWEHSLGVQVTGDVDFGQQATVNIRGERLRWFDEILLGRDTGIMDEPAVSVFVMGGGDNTRTPDAKLSAGGEWVRVESWPPSNVRYADVYLHGDGSLRPVAPVEPESQTTYLYDPENPVPTLGGQINSGDNVVHSGPWNQVCVKGEWVGCMDNLPLSARRDVLVFQTPPLAEDVVLNGPLTVRLWVSSSALDTDFTAKLVDVHPPSADYPEGYDLLITDRILRARHREGVEREVLMDPGEVYEIEIDLIGTATRFKRGHRIRLDISSSNFPFFDRNPNTGERLGHHTIMVPAENTVHHDRSRPSHIILPIVSGRLPVQP
ncbi:MAG: CocE/NonD family hydrolase [Dehalococcoidia bacterium]